MRPRPTFLAGRPQPVPDPEAAFSSELDIGAPAQACELGRCQSDPLIRSHPVSGCRPGHPRDRRDQGARIVLARAVQDGGGRTMLDHPAVLHDHDLIAEIAYDREIVGDQDERESYFTPELLEKAQDLRLDRDVERRGHFVGDQDLRLERKRAGDPDALALST